MHVSILVSFSLMRVTCVAECHGIALRPLRAMRLDERKLKRAPVWCCVSVAHLVETSSYRTPCASPSIAEQRLAPRAGPPRVDRDRHRRGTLAARGLERAGTHRKERSCSISFARWGLKPSASSGFGTGSSSPTETARRMSRRARCRIGSVRRQRLRQLSILTGPRR